MLYVATKITVFKLSTYWLRTSYILDSNKTELLDTKKKDTPVNSIVNKSVPCFVHFRDAYNMKGNLNDRIPIQNNKPVNPLPKYSSENG